MWMSNELGKKKGNIGDVKDDMSKSCLVEG